ncbi:YdcF family protein [Bacillus chungangensis]|uniref:Uncharacterized SAM-binding protein YcdF (DUF218 family) n=1 Tax=Bacillus chungangensis TaxID=587633 RepID=A0ABT9WTF4_9BACI|nr:YdcF family protein [Bacillus chungangensis]MDQ0176591.1 uncharacterized SAM-binding protein YcdF (DUF218 family) [Bacillus chungangensis]
MKKWFSIVIFICCFSFVVIHLSIVNAGKKSPEPNADYLVVLGAKLDGEQMSLSLLYRMNAAFTYLEANPNTKVIVSGGKGAGEIITEAEAMARFLEDNGIEKNRIIKEESSTSTYENLLFTKQLIGGKQKDIVIVSSDFHLFRAGIIAKRVGFEPQFLAAPTPEIVKIKLWLREYAVVVKSLLLDW